MRLLKKLQFQNHNLFVQMLKYLIFQKNFWNSNFLLSLNLQDNFQKLLYDLLSFVLIRFATEFQQANCNDAADCLKFQIGFALLILLYCSQILFSSAQESYL